MSETRHQHFVPKGYLREFGIGTGKDLHVWTLRLDKPNSKPEKISIGKTLCAEEYFYKVNTKESYVASLLGGDSNVIEKQGFSYENIIPYLFKELKGSKRVNLSLEDTSNLIQTLISIKLRNPYVRNIYKKASDLILIQTPIARQNLEEIISKIDPMNEGLVNEANEIKKKIEYDLQNIDELLNTLHSGAMYLGIDENIVEKVNELGTRLINVRWEIIETSLNHQFITSDNPGVFLSEKKVHPLTLGNFEERGIDRFFFPLSPLRGLLIYLLESDIYSGENKIIPVTYFPRKVSEYNISHCAYANQILIASSKSALIEAAKVGKNSWHEIK